MADPMVMTAQPRVISTIHFTLLQSQLEDTLSWVSLQSRRARQQYAILPANAEDGLNKGDSCGIQSALPYTPGGDT